LNLITHMDTYTLCRTPLDEGSARRRDLYVTTNNTHKKQTSIPPRNSNPNPSKRVATDLCLRPRSHWEWKGRHTPKLSGIGESFFLLLNVF